MYKIGIMGTAAIADRFMINAIKEVDDCIIYAIGSRDINSAKEFANRHNIQLVMTYEELVKCDEIDVIYMPLPTGLHYEWGVKALNNGKHILFEKSLASSVEQTQKLVNIAKHKNLLIDENFMFEHHQQQSALKQALQTVGTIKSFTANFGFPPLEESNFRYDVSLGGGALLDAGAYVIKCLGVFFPDYKIKILHALASFKRETDCDLSGGIYGIASNKSGSFPFFLNYGFDNAYKCGVEIWGSESILTTDRTFTAGPSVIPQIWKIDNNTWTNIKTTTDNHFRNKFEDFIFKIQSQCYSKTYDDIIRQSKLLEDVKKYIYV